MLLLPEELTEEIFVSARSGTAFLLTVFVIAGPRAAGFAEGFEAVAGTCLALGVCTLSFRGGFTPGFCPREEFFAVDELPVVLSSDVEVSLQRLPLCLCASY